MSAGPDEEAGLVRGRRVRQSERPDKRPFSLTGAGEAHDLLLVSDERESSGTEGLLDGARRSRAIRSGPGHGVTLLAEPEIRAALPRWLQTGVR